MRKTLIALGLAAALVGGTVAVASAQAGGQCPPACGSDDLHWPNPDITPTPGT
ncbi:hypothetical protein OIE66_22210 [Nonomuraea sp. NBC_01738]|uniref:hypothetical protein n=1 Tax=Nonomuraea sp. NBC_01738 TaxID=2976003 RepID=UPI002E12CBB2|nr:hypothetical protein OIE66_22210 [Nonomuraea sp. NBC_01738]